MSQPSNLLDVFHDEVNAVGPLEHKLHSHNEGVVHLQQDQFLQLDVLQRVILQDDVLSDALHGEVTLLGRQVHQVDLQQSVNPLLPYLSKVASANDTDQLKVFQVEVLVLRGSAIQ